MSDNTSALRWDIFCTVIDNYGDIGVCWRLARQLTAHQVQVRLWVDNLAALRSIAPHAPDADQQTLDGVEVCRWNQVLADAAAPADVVIEAFACELPPTYLLRMAARVPAPVWINLEYLSAEQWVPGCHGMHSPHPQLGLNKHFFFPGLQAGTGGVLKENDLDARRQSWLADIPAQTRFWTDRGLPPPAPDALKVSLFAYDNPALPALLDAWATQDAPVYCAVPVGRPLPGIARWTSRPTLAAGDTIDAGALRIVILPFMAQDDYDHLLWSSDLNFVRGEDSFVRAQWACRPFIWHIYPQSDAAHMNKLQAFLHLYTANGSTPENTALQTATLAWNGCGDMGAAWSDLRQTLPALAQHTAQWAVSLAKFGNLADNLMLFCQRLVK